MSHLNGFLKAAAPLTVGTEIVAVLGRKGRSPQAIVEAATRLARFGAVLAAVRYVRALHVCDPCNTEQPCAGVLRFNCVLVSNLPAFWRFEMGLVVMSRMSRKHRLAGVGGSGKRMGSGRVTWIGAVAAAAHYAFRPFHWTGALSVESGTPTPRLMRDMLEQPVLQ
jgi:hypothetical protein